MLDDDFDASLDDTFIGPISMPVSVPVSVPVPGSPPTLTLILTSIPTSIPISPATLLAVAVAVPCDEVGSPLYAPSRSTYSRYLRLMASLASESLLMGLVSSLKSLATISLIESSTLSYINLLTWLPF
jgi:hypothetical protein